MKKSLCLLLCVLLLTAPFLSACDSAMPGASVAPDPSLPPSNTGGQPASAVEVNHYSWDIENAYILPVVEKFNASQSEVKVNYFSFPHAGDEYYNKILTMLQGDGSDVDLMGINATPWYAAYYSNGITLGLNSLIQSTGYDITPHGTLFTQYAMDGEYYALPHRRTTYLLYYNKEIFDREGVPYPDDLTWDEFRELAKQLTHGEGQDKQWGCMASMALYSFQIPANQMGATPQIDDDLAPLEWALNMWYDIFYTDQSSMSYPEIIAHPSVLSVFMEGHVAMYPNGEWMINQIMDEVSKGKASIEWDFTTLPVPPGVESGVSVGQGTFTGINSKSTKPEAAFKWLAYFCGKEGALVQAQQGILPCYSSDEVKQAFIDATQKVAATKVFDMTVNIELPVHQKIKQIDDALRVQTDLLYSQEQDLATTISNFESARLRLLS